jgi:hypothetical protein
MLDNLSHECIDLQSFLFSGQLLLCSRNHMVWLESELPLELLERRRCTERVHANNASRRANVFFPAKG